MCESDQNTNISKTNNNFHIINSLSSINENNNDNKLKAALYYAEELHWKIFPCHTVNENGKCSCGNPKCTNQGKHPHIFDWQQKATDNPNIIKAWWKKWPGANIGLLTGLKNNIFVLDVDDGGIEYLEENELNLNKDILKRTAMSKTGRTEGEGRHVLYKYDSDLIELIGKEIGNRVKFLPGLDLRAKGGFIILPPSDHLSGNKYKWLLPPGENSIEEPPGWLIETLKQKPKCRRKLSFSEIPNGQRNNTLFEYARNQWGLGLEEEDVFESVELMNQRKCEEPLPVSEIRAIVKSAAKFVSHNESIIQVCEENFLRYNENNKIVGLKHEKLANFVLENNKIFKLKESNSLMFYNPKKGIFEEKDEKSSNSRLDSLAIGLLGKKYERLWKASSRNDYRALIKPKIDEISIEEFDLHDDKIAVENGVINLRTSELLDFDHKYRFTKRIDVDYDPKAYSEDWENFLDQICCLDDQKASDEELEDRKELRKYIALVDGYRLTGERNDESIYLPIGAGSNGKSVHHNTISEILGAYAITVPESVITTNNYGDSKAYALAQMQGCRSVNANEVSAGKKLDIEMIKKVTGDDKTNARHPYGRPFQIRNTFKMFIVGNSELFLGIQDRAIRRRLKVIPYNLNLSDDEIDPQIKKKLLANKPAILKYLVDNAREYYRTNGKIKVAKLVKEASEGYLEATDPLKGYVRDCINFGQKSSSVKMSDLYKNYKIFAEVEGFKAHSAIWFGRHFKAAMKSKNVDSDKQKGGRRTFFDITCNEVEPPEDTCTQVERGW